jgi:hypothetical protein
MQAAGVALAVGSISVCHWLPVLSKSVARNHERLSRGDNRCRENCQRSGVRSVAPLNYSIDVEHFGNLSERVYEFYESLGIESPVLRCTGKPVAHKSCAGVRPCFRFSSTEL